MKTKWMCMILMFALALNLSACGNRQENGNSSENGAINIEPQSVEDDSSENTGNESSEMNVIDLQDNGTDKNIMTVSTVKDSAFSGKVSGCYYAGGSRIIVAAPALSLRYGERRSNRKRGYFHGRFMCTDFYRRLLCCAARERLAAATVHLPHQKATVSLDTY